MHGVGGVKLSAMLVLPRALIHLLMIGLSLGLSGCASPTRRWVAPEQLEVINAAVNRRGLPCPQDVCLEQWPEPAALAQLTAWDCKAYAVAKANWLIHHSGYDPDRLEYILIEGTPLRVTHAALLVDGRWVMDSGLRCQVCPLEHFAHGLRVAGRLAVSDLAYLRYLMASPQH